jgi:hypothetical protein
VELFRFETFTVVVEVAMSEYFLFWMEYSQQPRIETSFVVGMKTACR